MVNADPGPVAAPGRRWLTADLVGTGVFALALVISIPARQHRWAQFLIGAVSMVLFAVGVVTALWAYVTAVERSRHEEIGTANLFLLTGPTAPRPIKRSMSLLLATQVVLALGGAIVGVVGLDKGDLNALAFGVLVPMLGLGLNGIWAARHGTFGPRLVKSDTPTQRPIG